MIRSPLVPTLLTLLMLSWRSVSARGEDLAAQIAELRTWVSAGRHDEVVAGAARLLESRPLDARPTAWAVDFRKTTVEDIRIGKRYLYFKRMASARERRSNRPDLDPLAERVPPEGRNYGWLVSVTCVDGRNGERLWTRHFIPHTQLALDPRDDALWTWHRDPGASILRVDPVSGDATVRGVMPPEWKNIDPPRGLRVDGLRLWSLATANTRDLSLDDELDLDLDASGVKRQAFHPDLMSRNGLRVLRWSGFQSPEGGSTSVELVPAVAGVRPVPDWSYPTQGPLANPPVWVGNDVLILTGNTDSCGAVTRLDGKTGRPRWAHVLPEPAGVPGLPQLQGGSYPPRGWSAIGMAAGKVVAVGGWGTLFFLDPETGEEVSRLTTGTPLLALPRVIADRVVLAGVSGIRAVPLHLALGGGQQPDAWLDLRALQARSLRASGRAVEAIEVASVMARERPDVAEGWSLLAEMLEGADRDAEAVVVRTAAMAASGSREDARLRSSHGLLCRLPTAPVTAAPVVAGPLLLLGCRDGRFLTVDTRDLRILQVEQSPTEIAGLTLDQDGSRLVRRGQDRQVVPVRILNPPSRDLLPFDPLRSQEEPTGLPRAWYSVNSLTPPAILIGDRRVRPLRGGSVRVLQGREVIDRPPAVAGELTRWRIALIDGQPFGYGTGGVYRLDADFRPVERIVNSAPASAEAPGQSRNQNRETMVYALAGDETTLCVLLGTFRDMTLQVRSKDGSRLIREEPVRPARQAFDEPYRLRSLGAGYLLSAGELLWVPRTAAERPWRFATQLDPASSPSRPEFAGENAVFGVPRIVGDRLFVAAHGGGLYGFALDAIIGSRASKPTAPP